MSREAHQRHNVLLHLGERSKITTGLMDFCKFTKSPQISTPYPRGTPAYSEDRAEEAKDYPLLETA